MNTDIHDAAVRALADWPNPTPLEDLLRIAEESESMVQQVLALRAYIRMVEMVEYRLAEDAVGLLKRRASFSQAARGEEDSPRSAASFCL